MAEEGKTVRERRKKTEKDFQTINVPGTGAAVRKLIVAQYIPPCE